MRSAFWVSCLRPGDLIFTQKISNGSFNRGRLVVAIVCKEEENKVVVTWQHLWGPNFTTTSSMYKRQYAYDSVYTAENVVRDGKFLSVEKCHETNG